MELDLAVRAMTSDVLSSKAVVLLAVVRRCISQYAQFEFAGGWLCEKPAGYEMGSDMFFYFCKKCW